MQKILIFCKISFAIYIFWRCIICSIVIIYSHMIYIFCCIYTYLQYVFAIYFYISFTADPEGGLSGVPWEWPPWGGLQSGAMGPGGVLRVILRCSIGLKSLLLLHWYTFFIQFHAFLYICIYFLSIAINLNTFIIYYVWL